jgi:hypothetical protein
VVEVDDADLFGAGASACVLEGDTDAVADQAVEFAVGRNRGHRLPPVAEPVQGVVDSRFGDLGVEGDSGGLEAVAEDDVAFVGASGAVVEVGGVGGVAVLNVVTVEVLQVLHHGLFKIVL